MPLGASRLTSISKAIVSVAPPVASTTVDYDDSGATIARIGTMRTQVVFCGFNSNDRPVFAYGYNAGSSVGQILMWVVNSDGSVTYGTPYTMPDNCGYEINVTTEYEGENRFDQSTTQDHVGYVAYQLTTGYQITYVRAFYYDVDTLSVTTMGSRVGSTLTAVTNPLAYVGTRRIATSGRGGNNAKYHQVSYFTRTANSLTMSLTASTGNQLPAGQGGLGSLFGFGNDCCAMVEISGNNGRGQQGGAHKLQGSTVYSTGSGTEFFNQYSVTKTIGCQIDSTGKIAAVGYGGGRNPAYANSDLRMQIIDYDFKVGTTNTPTKTNGKTFRMGGYTNRFSAASGHAENEMYVLAVDVYETSGGRPLKMKKVDVSSTGNRCTIDSNWVTIDQNDTTTLDQYEEGTGRSVTTPDGDEVVTFAARQWNANNLVILAVQNFQRDNATAARTPNDVTLTGSNQNFTVKKTDQSSIYFSGSNSSYAQLDQTVSQMMPTTDEWTIEFYWYPLNVTNTQGIIGGHNSGSNDFWIGTENSKMVFKHDTIGNLASTTTLALSTWYHVAVVNDGTSVKLYLNGTQEDSLTTPGSYGWENVRMSLGRAGSNLYPFYGYLDYVCIQKTARYLSNFTVNNWLPFDSTDVIFATNPLNANYNNASTEALDNVSGRGYPPVDSPYTTDYQDIP